jgi:hypothetical protein
MNHGNITLAYHGCDRNVGEALLAGEAFRPSCNPYDWLGNGVYFWEKNECRAWEWAVGESLRKRGRVKQPFAVGAVLDLGECLDTTESDSLNNIKGAYDGFQKLAESRGEPLVKNEKSAPSDNDHTKRFLDCAVLNYLHETRKDNNLSPFDTVRGVFCEGGQLFHGSGFNARTHIQICVCNTANILGVFRCNTQT